MQYGHDVEVWWEVRAAKRGAVGGVGGIPLGCFEINRFHVVLLSGARPEEVRV